jgi:hypothetical protein
LYFRLFGLELPAIVFGFLYFIIIFADKWAILVGTGTVGVFIPNASQLNQGITFAAIYLLLSSGFLELTLVSCAHAINLFKYENLSTVNDPRELIQQYQQYIERIYRGEFRLFLIRSSIIFVIMAVVAVSVGWSDPSKTIVWVFAGFSFSFFGLLLGLFNKMFIGVEEEKLNILLLVSIVISVLTSGLMIRFFNNNTYSLIATLLSCWLFGGSCMIIRYRERVRSPYYEISICKSCI